MQARKLVAAATAALMLAATTAEASVSVSRVITRDKFAYANYFETSADGCESLSIEVFASRSMTRTNDAFTFQPLLRAQLSSYNYCTSVSNFMSGTSDAAPKIRFGEDIAVASASGIVVMVDENGASKTVFVNLEWRGGVLTTDKTKTIETSPTSRTIVRTTGSIRVAEAVTGTLLLEGTDVLSPNHATQSAFINGFITSSKGATIEIVRNR
jgi:hypothetical protein